MGYRFAKSTFSCFCLLTRYRTDSAYGGAVCASCVARPKREGHALRVLLFLEAPPGIGPGIKVLQTSALPLGYGAEYGADYGARTRHLHLGKVALYQMS